MFRMVQALVFALVFLILSRGNAQTVRGDLVRLNPSVLPTRCAIGDLRVDTADSYKLKLCNPVDTWAEITPTAPTYTASRALVSDGSGVIATSSTTATEVGYLAGVSSAIQTQIDLKAPIASPTFTGTVSGITKSMVGLGNVDNTSDADKPVSTATQTALDAKVGALAAVGSSANANGATISGSTLNLEPASASFPGVVTTGTQTMAGAKTFSGNVNIGGTTIMSGSVGIGFTNPAGALKVKSNGADWHSGFTLFSSNGTHEWQWYPETNGYLYWRNPNFGYVLVSDNTGKVGIGTGSPEAQLTVGAFAADVVQLSVRSHTTQTSNVAQFKDTGGTVSSYIKANGGVGIGGTATSSTVPALYFVGDTNTGISTSAADTVNIVTGGSTAAQFNADYSMQFMQQIATPATPASNTIKMYQKSDDKLYVLNDAGLETQVGGGSGGSSGINMLSGFNHNGESGSTIYWSETGGGALIITSTVIDGANVGAGTYAISYDASAASDYLITDAQTIPSGLRGANCLLEFYYKGFDANMTAQVHDGSNVVATQALVASTGFTKQQINFVCPSNGTLAFKLLAGADAAIGYVDEVHLGSASNISNVSQAALYGSVNSTGTASCQWSVTSSTLAVPAADSDCPTATAYGNASAPATKIPAITFATMPPGKYVVKSNLNLFPSSATHTCFARFHDGTNPGRGAQSQIFRHTGDADVSAFGNTYLEQTFEYTTAQAAKTFSVQMSSTDNVTSCLLSANASTSDFAIDVEYYPTDSQQAISTANQNWRVDANISGANIDLGTTDQATYVYMSNSSLTLTNNTGSGVLTAQIPCTTTVASSGTTCSSGSETNGVAFTIPRAGDVRACVSFTHNLSTSASGNINATFQILETSNTLTGASCGSFPTADCLQEGKQRINSANSVPSTTVNFPHKVCGTFTFSSAGQKTLRLYYEQDNTATVGGNTVIGDASATLGQRDVHWEVYPIDVQAQAPTLVGSVTSTSSGPVKIEAANLNCDAGSAITSQLAGTSWVSSIGNISTGACAVTLASGYASAPYCWAEVTGAISTGLELSVTASSATAVSVDCEDDASTACTTFDFNLFCMGPK